MRGEESTAAKGSIGEISSHRLYAIAPSHLHPSSTHPRHVPLSANHDTIIL
jgi:hypothetical protein